MTFQAHLILVIKERGFTNAAHVAWGITDRLRKAGHEAYVASITRPQSLAKRQRRRTKSQSKSKTESPSP
jgi:hypothetical protein